MSNNTYYLLYGETICTFAKEPLQFLFSAFPNNLGYRHDENGIVPANIPEEYRWNGTIILVKVPLTAPSGFSFYNYVE